MADQFSRTRLLVGSDGMEKLQESSVAVFGIGGVGGYVCEALARSGISKFLLVDNDVVSLSNINRQIIATHRTVGLPKVQVMKERILEINPEAVVETRQCFYLPENADTFDFSSYSYIIDAVDTVAAKTSIILEAKKCGVHVISSMGAGNKLDPTKFLVADIFKTSVCPLARVMRREMKKHGIDSLKVVYSTEVPVEPKALDEELESKGSAGRTAPGSIAFVPSVAGLVIAGEVIKDLALEV